MVLGSYLPEPPANRGEIHQNASDLLLVDIKNVADKWENEDLNNTELAYYIDVQARVSKKLLEVAG